MPFFGGQAMQAQRVFVARHTHAAAVHGRDRERLQGNRREIVAKGQYVLSLLEMECTPRERLR